PAAQGAGLVRADGVEERVDHHVEAAEEEARDRVHAAYALATPQPVLEAAQVRVDHALVALEAEEEGHVHVHAVGDQAPDRAEAGDGGGDLDEDVGPAQAPPEVAALAVRGLLVVGHLGRDLERDEAVAAARAVVGGAEEVGGALDVLDDELLVRLVDAGPALGEGGDRLAVVV